MPTSMNGALLLVPSLAAMALLACGSRGENGVSAGPERQDASTEPQTMAEAGEAEASSSKPAVPGDGIVYVRVPRGTTPITLSNDEFPGLGGKQLDPSYLDTFPEVAYIRRGFNAPGQLVWRHADGSETIIYDCTGATPSQEPGPPQNGEDTCVPMDPAVSYDATRVAFAVYHGTYAKTQDLTTQNSGEVGKLDPGTEAAIYVYDFGTGQLTPWPHTKGTWDVSPVWLPNGQMMFSSTRSGMYQRFAMNFGITDVVQQLWIADADGSNARNVDPHDQQDAIHPFVHSSGRVLFSSQQYNAVRGDGETVINLWWLMSVDLRGGDTNAHLHAHAFKLSNLTLTAPHFIGQRSNGDACTDMYYRRNNFGAGQIVCWPTQTASRSPLDHEGADPFNYPDGYYTAVGGDLGDSGGAGGGPDGHVRDPAALPNGELMYAGGIGPNAQCHWYGGGPNDVAQMAALTAKGQTCDFGIYTSHGIPEVSPDSDAVLVVNTKEWHEIMPRPVLPYSAIYGIPAPAQPPLTNTSDGSSVLESVTAFEGNVTAAGGWHGPGDPSWCKFQGCALQAVPLTDIAAIRFWAALPNEQAYTNGQPLHDNWGQQLKLLGDVPVQTDGSFKAQLPADTPFLMAGVDAQGRSIARHQSLMSMRPGEQQECAGCHLHDTTEATNAQHPFGSTMAAVAPAVVPAIPAAEQGVLEWKADVYPMLNQQCATCHTGGAGSPAPDFAANEQALYQELTNGDSPQYPSTDGPQPTIAYPPWMTRYVNAFFARESLLYWKAAGARLDGRQDADLPNDFDFGPAHPTHLSADQLKILADWIEAGAYRASP